MPEKPGVFSTNVGAYLCQVGGEIVSLRPDRSLPALFRWVRDNLGDLAIAGVIFLLVHQFYFWTGYIFMNRGVFYRPSDILFGFDIPRSVFDIVERGHNARSHVHPYFILFAKPLGILYNQFLGLSVHRAAIAVTAMVQAGAVALSYGFFRLWRLPRIDAAIFAFLFGLTSICYFSGFVPETRAFAVLALGLNAVLVGHTLERGRRSESAWLLVGFYTYGITISNFLKTGLAHGFSGLKLRRFWPQFSQTTIYCTTVVVAGIITTMVVGSSFNLLADTWIATADERRGGALDNMPVRVGIAFFFYDVVMPVPNMSRVTFGDHLVNEPVAHLNAPEHTALQVGLMVIWALAWLGNYALAFRRKRPEELRLLLILGLWMIWDCVFFAKYYVPFEGVYHWSSHIIVPVVFSLVPLARGISEMRTKARLAARTAIVIFIALLAMNNIQMVFKCLELLTNA